VDRCGESRLASIYKGENIKHTIEFYYDGCDRWAINGGSIVGPRTVQSYIGREAFFEALKHGESFKVTMDMIVEPIND
jgi:hypothetical protein